MSKELTNQQELRLLTEYQQLVGQRVTQQHVYRPRNLGSGHFETLAPYNNSETPSAAFHTTSLSPFLSLHNVGTPPEASVLTSESPVVVGCSSTPSGFNVDGTANIYQDRSKSKFEQLLTKLISTTHTMAPITSDQQISNEQIRVGDGTGEQRTLKDRKVIFPSDTTRSVGKRSNISTKLPEEKPLKGAFTGSGKRNGPLCIPSHSGTRVSSRGRGTNGGQAALSRVPHFRENSGFDDASSRNGGKVTRTNLPSRGGSDGRRADVGSIEPSAGHLNDPTFSFSDRGESPVQNHSELASSVQNLFAVADKYGGVLGTDWKTVVSDVAEKESFPLRSPVHRLPSHQGVQAEDHPFSSSNRRNPLQMWQRCFDDNSFNSNTHTGNPWNQDNSSFSRQSSERDAKGLPYAQAGEKYIQGEAVDRGKQYVPPSKYHYENHRNEYSKTRNEKVQRKQVQVAPSLQENEESCHYLNQKQHRDGFGNLEKAYGHGGCHTGQRHQFKLPHDELLNSSHNNSNYQRPYDYGIQSGDQYLYQQNFRENDSAEDGAQYNRGGEIIASRSVKGRGKKEKLLCLNKGAPRKKVPRDDMNEYPITEHLVGEYNSGASMWNPSDSSLRQIRSKNGATRNDRNKGEYLQNGQIGYSKSFAEFIPHFPMNNRDHQDNEPYRYHGDKSDPYNSEGKEEPGIHTYHSVRKNPSKVVTDGDISEPVNHSTMYLAAVSKHPSHKSNYMDGEVKSEWRKSPDWCLQQPRRQPHYETHHQISVGKSKRSSGGFSIGRTINEATHAYKYPQQSRTYGLVISMPINLPYGKLKVSKTNGENFYVFPDENLKKDVPDYSTSAKLLFSANEGVCDAWASFLQIKLGHIKNVKGNEIPTIIKIFHSVMRSPVSLLPPEKSATNDTADDNQLSSRFLFPSPIKLKCCGLQVATEEHQDEQGQGANGHSAATRDASNNLELEKSQQKANSHESIPKLETRGFLDGLESERQFMILCIQLKRFARALGSESIDLSLNETLSDEELARLMEEYDQIFGSTTSATTNKQSSMADPCGTILSPKPTGPSCPFVRPSSVRVSLSRFIVDREVALSKGLPILVNEYGDVKNKELENSLMNDKEFANSHSVEGVEVSEIRLSHESKKMVDPRFSSQPVLTRQMAGGEDPQRWSDISRQTRYRQEDLLAGALPSIVNCPPTNQQDHLTDCIDGPQNASIDLSSENRQLLDQESRVGEQPLNPSTLKIGRYVFCPKARVPKIEFSLPNLMKNCLSSRHGFIYKRPIQQLQTAYPQQE